MTKRTGLIRNIRTNILVGLFLLTPIAATIVVLNFLFTLATGWLPAIFDPLLNLAGPVYLQRFIILLITLLLLYLAGILVRNLIGRRLYRYSEWLLARIPLVRQIYSSSSRILGALFSQRKTLFKEAVMVEYPRRGLYSIAFVTATLPADMVQTAVGSVRDEQWISLFVPTTPNPTSGILICVPRSQVRPLSMPVTDAMTFIISAGAVASNEAGGQATLLDKIDEWLQAQSSTSIPEHRHNDEH